MNKKKTKRSKLEAFFSSEIEHLAFGIHSDERVELIASDTPAIVHGVDASAMPSEKPSMLKPKNCDNAILLNLKQIADEVMEKIPKPLEDAEFLSKEAGSFSGVEQRTVQLWTEKGLIIPMEDTTGKGKRRKYSVLNCIEIGIVQRLTKMGLYYKYIKKIMDLLRETE